MPSLADGWTERDVTFTTSVGVLHGTLTQPIDQTVMTSAALIIGGSGPTDRNGDSALIPGDIGSLRAIGRWLAADGVATLRYDKIGSGETGLAGRSPESLAALTAQDYLTANSEALTYLADQPGVDPNRLSVVGHSEGAMFGLQLAVGEHGAATNARIVHGLATVQPQASPFLDLLTKQLTGQVDDAVSADQMTRESGDALLASLEDAVEATRAGKSLPDDLPPPIAPLFDPSALTYLRTIDMVDPRVIANGLPSRLTVLVTCSEADIQVACEDVDQLTAAAQISAADITSIRLVDMAHTLKVDTSRNPTNYGNDLPFSPELADALESWAKACC